ncbi:hypothetical protein GCM10010094_90820 [Streptomyces flaveus]|uniref:Uncharacterized protein n=1 Tax=Streptomyces flaveus TaxID=66370 RepID=A0A917RNN0_9ACTN|nr:hypothetical protein GCM10010094_90820 [Streptomyces flaveus]
MVLSLLVIAKSPSATAAPAQSHTIDYLLSHSNWTSSSFSPILRLVLDGQHPNDTVAASGLP